MPAEEGTRTVVGLQCEDGKPSLRLGIDGGYVDRNGFDRSRARARAVVRRRHDWEIRWLILGFTLSGVVQAVVSKREMRRLMPDDSLKTLLVSSGLGAASSS